MRRMWTGPRSRLLDLTISLVLLLAFAPALYAQLAAEHGGARIPTDNEAALLVQQLADAVVRGEHRRAIGLADEIFGRASGLVRTPAGRTFIPAAELAARHLARLSPDGVLLYRQLRDSETSALLTSAAERGDVAKLERLFLERRLSTHWPEVGAELVAHALDAGDFSTALAVCDQLLDADVEEGWRIAGQRVVALANLGATGAVRDALDELRRTTEAGASDRQRLLTRLEGWLDGLAADATGAEAPGATGPCVLPAVGWQSELHAESASGPAYSDASIASYAADARRLPLQWATVSDGMLFVRQHQMLWAFDATTITLRWTAKQRQDRSAASDSVRDTFDVEDDSLGACPARLRPLFEHAAEHAVTAGFGLVFTIESISSPDADSVWEVRRWGAAGQAHTPSGASELVARDAHTGEVHWTLGRDALRPLYGVGFPDAPAVRDRELLAVYQSGTELRVGVLEPLSGDLLAEMTLAASPEYLTGEAGLCQIRADRRDVFVSTGNGIIAALRYDTRQSATDIMSPERGGELTWRWAFEYPSLPPDVDGPIWPGDPPSPRRGPMLAPALGQDLLILAPPDSDEIIALEHRTGRQRWRIPRGDVRSLIGILPGGLVMAGSHVRCVDLVDGRSVRWRSVPLAVTGRGAVVGGRVYVPTRDGVVALDSETGKVVIDQWQPTATRQPPGWTPLANLVMGTDCIYGVTPNRVLKYADSDATRAGWSDAAEGELDDEDRYVLAATDATIGDFPAARAHLAGVAMRDEQLRTASTNLLVEVLLAQALQTDDVGQRLELLREAAENAPAGEIASRIVLMMAKTLVSDRQLEAAAGQYLGLLESGDVDAATLAVAGPRHRIAAWRHAAAGLAGVLPRLTPAQLDAVVDETVERANTRDDRRTLERLALAVADDEVLKGRVTAALATWEFVGSDESRRRPLAPELLAARIQALDSSRLEPDDARRLLLKLWETATALGQAEQAADCAREWESLAISEDTLGQRERSVLRRVRRSQTPLAASRAAELRPDFRRHWTLDGHELVIDADSMPADDRAPILVRALTEQRIRLVSLRDGGERLVTTDGVTSSAATASLLHSAAVDSLFKGTELRSAAPPHWTAVQYGHLLAAPVTGGIVGCGLGTALGGGTRLWDYPIEHWRTVPPTMARRAVADSGGVCFLTRPDCLVRVGWMRGELHWERDLPGARISSIARAGRSLVVITEDGRGYVLDAELGYPLRALPESAGRLVDVVSAGAMIVRATTEGLFGIEPDTLNVAWSQPCNGMFDIRAVQGASLIACQPQQGGDWWVYDADTGAELLRAPLSGGGAVSTLAVRDEQLLAASATHLDGFASASVAAYALDDGAEIWQTHVAGGLEFNLSQLVAHPEYIVALCRAKTGAASEDAVSGLFNANEAAAELALKLISRSTGELVEFRDDAEAAPRTARDISRDFADVDSTRGVSLWVTPTRIVVQAGGRIVAYGSARSASDP